MEVEGSWCEYRPTNWRNIIDNEEKDAVPKQAEVLIGAKNDLEEWIKNNVPGPEPEPSKTVCSYP